MAKRRAPGEGSSPRLRKDGRWEARYSVTEGGVVQRKAVYAATSRECTQKLRAALRDRDAGLETLSDRYTVKQYLEHWMTEIVAPKRSARTVETYRTQIDKRILPALGAIPLKRLTPGKIQALLNGMQKEGLATRTMEVLLATLHAALAYAVRTRMLDWNPAVQVEVPKGTPPPFVAKTLSAEEARAFLDACRAAGMELLFTFPLLGLRLQEFRLLKWEHLDLERNLFRVPGTKTEGSKRVLPLLPNHRRLLEAHRARQKLDSRIAGEGWTEEGYVFTGPSGAPLGTRTIQHRFTRLLASAKAPKIRLHDLRHSCATLLMAEGVPLKTIQVILGHTQLSTTADLYVHILPGALEAALAPLDALFGE